MTGGEGAGVAGNELSMRTRWVGKGEVVGATDKVSSEGMGRGAVCGSCTGLFTCCACKGLRC